MPMTMDQIEVTIASNGWEVARRTASGQYLPMDYFENNRSGKGGKAAAVRYGARMAGQFAAKLLVEEEL